MWNQYCAEACGQSAAASSVSTPKAAIDPSERAGYWRRASSQTMKSAGSSLIAAATPISRPRNLRWHDEEVDEDHEQQ